MEHKTVQNDFIDFPTGVFRKTPEGFLSGRLCVTGAGVFRYIDASGGVVGRLRSRDEVEKATASLNSKPVTLLHPSEMVSPENAKALQVGYTGTDASWDGLNNYVTLTVTDRAAIEAIEAGRVKAVSCGYECGIVDNSGVWQGTPYGQEQKDIAYNHVALVSEGRAGDQVRFRVGDSANAREIFGAQKLTSKRKDAMKTIQIDGVECQADEKVVSALEALKAENARRTEELGKLSAERDSMGARIGELEKAVDGFDAKVLDAVRERVALVDLAKRLGAEATADDSADGIRRKVIALAFDKVDLEGKSGDYVAATFDAAVAVLEKAAEAKKSAGKTVLDAPGKNTQTDESAHDAMERSIYELGKKKEG